MMTYICDFVGSAIIMCHYCFVVVVVRNPHSYYPLSLSTGLQRMYPPRQALLLAASTWGQFITIDMQVLVLTLSHANKHDPMLACLFEVLVLTPFHANNHDHNNKGIHTLS